ncbi:MAG: hypothetical protein RMJ98_14505, partial [Myxococcales bacterium]|nr:hypothetical protein [Myxococcales bacterium]
PPSREIQSAAPSSSAPPPAESPPPLASSFVTQPVEEQNSGGALCYRLEARARRYLSVSTDGSRAIFWEPGTSSNGDVRLLDLRQRILVHLSPGRNPEHPSLGPSFAPDGTVIVAKTQREHGGQPLVTNVIAEKHYFKTRGTAQLHRIHLESGQTAPLTLHPAQDPAGGGTGQHALDAAQRRLGPGATPPLGEHTLTLLPLRFPALSLRSSSRDRGRSKDEA